MASTLPCILFGILLLITWISNAVYADLPECEALQDKYGRDDIGDIIQNAPNIAFASLTRGTPRFMSSRRLKGRLPTGKLFTIPQYDRNPEMKKHEILLFLADGADLKYRLYNDSLQPVSFYKNRTAKTSVMKCVSYHLLPQQVPQITVHHYTQKDWRTQEHLYYIEEGTEFGMDCETTQSKRYGYYLWNLPDKKVMNGSFIDVSEEGNYSCIEHLEDKKSQSEFVRIEFIDKTSSKLELNSNTSALEIQYNGDDTPPMDWNISFLAYPADIHFTWELEGKSLLNFTCQDTTKDNLKITCNYKEGNLVLSLPRPSLQDPGKHTLKAEVLKDGRILKRKEMSLQLTIMKHQLEVYLSLETPDRDKVKENQVLAKGSKVLLCCFVKGHPVGEVHLMFTPCLSFNNCSTSYVNHNKIPPVHVANRSTDLESLSAEKHRVWEMTVQAQGLYGCHASNGNGTLFSSKTIRLVVSDYGQLSAVSSEAEIKTPETNETIYKKDSPITLIEEDSVILKCRKNKMVDIRDFLWWNSSDIDLNKENTTMKEEKYSFVQEWNLDGENLSRYNGTKIYCGSDDAKQILVKKPEAPRFLKSRLSLEDIVKDLKKLTATSKLNLSCKATGIPLPIIKWFKDDKPLVKYPGRISVDKDHTLRIQYFTHSDFGVYKCTVSNRCGNLFDEVDLHVLNHQSIIMITFIAFGILCLLISTCCWVISVRVKKKKEHFLGKAELESFQRGNPDHLNPNMELGEQADLLPYDNSFEIQRKRIEMDKLIGSGAFGQVFRAKVDRLLPHESQTIVAVKMAKSRTDASQMKALRAEVKIMIHIGRHVNIVNLLGVCCESIATKGELLVLVEYCLHGNLKDYIKRHKSTFVENNALISSSQSEANQESVLYKRINGAPSLPDTVITGISSCQGSVNDLRTVGNGRVPLLHVTDTDGVPTHTASAMNLSKPAFCDLNYRANTYIGSNSSVGMAPSVFSDSYSSRPNLSHSDLMTWANQIAKGMEFISLRKVVHGDLATRNILLDENYVVKISDFGFAKDVYQNNYKKDSECPMPVKWMSPEYIREGVRSIQSDIWAFGVVLWEIFTLGQSPYPGVELDNTFLEKIEAGYRLSQPKHSSEKLYKLMSECWDKNPMARPSFSSLGKNLSRMVSSREREQFEYMNKPFDTQTMSAFLASLSNPDYGSIMRGETSGHSGASIASNMESPSSPVRVQPCNSTVTYQPVANGQSIPTNYSDRSSISSNGSDSDEGEEEGLQDGYLCMSNVSGNNSIDDMDRSDEGSNPDDTRISMEYVNGI